MEMGEERRHKISLGGEGEGDRRGEREGEGGRKKRNTLLESH